ncbi:MAG: hypothetical protein J1E84_07905 [Muribaculaceae bacterium]|nr:hypothetical protein [Muribaculaceae bacterium]
MRKILTVLLAMAFAMNLCAQDIDTQGSAGKNLNMEGIIEKLEKSEGYVFLGKDDQRNLRDIFHRSNDIKMGDEPQDPNVHDVLEYHWEVANEGIATLQRDTEAEAIYVKGTRFGETFLTATLPNSTEVHHFAVFVCPTITVLSPEGIVYSYQKTFKQPARIELTRSNEYHINCVMMKRDDSDWEDITAKVAYGPDLNDNDDLKVNDNDGYYESKDPIEGDMVFVISEELSQDYKNGDVPENVGSSGLNLQVRGHEITVMYDGSRDGTNYEDIANLSEAEINITDVNKKPVNYDSQKSDLVNGKIWIPSQGIFYIYIDNTGDTVGDQGNFKVIIHDL